MIKLPKIIKAFLVVTLLAVITIFVFFWIEAEKEVRILCSMFKTETPISDVIRMLETGNLLEYEQDESFISVSSNYTLKTSKCEVVFSEEDSVIKAEYTIGF